jgi:hypothetical protein
MSVKRRADTALTAALAANAAVLIIKRFVESAALDFAQGVVLGILLVAVALKVALERVPRLAKRLNYQDTDERVRLIRTAAAERSFWITQLILVILEIAMLKFAGETAFFFALAAQALSLLSFLAQKLSPR